MMLSRTVTAVWGIFVCVFCVLPCVVLAADASLGTVVTVLRSDQVFRIDSVSRIVAGRDVAWAVLTDYDGYIHFVPGMTVSRRVGDQPLRIEQRGEFGVLFFRKPVHATLEVVESPPSDIYFQSVEGNLRTLETEVNIRSDGDQVIVTYRSVIEPDFWVPPLIGTAIVRAAIRRKLGAVAEEIERRANFRAGQ